MTQFLPLTAGGLTYVLAYDPSGTPPPENQKPSFTSTPVETATQNEAYEYTAVATDPEGDEITYSLDTFPDGMTIVAATGVVDWTPTEAATESVVIRATDEHGAYETQSFSVVVAEGTNDVTLDVAATNGTVDVEVVSGSGSDGTYAQGSVLRLIGHANEGYCFSAFSGDLVSSLNMQTITMDGNKSVTASFSAIVGNAVAINAAWLAAAGSAPYYLDDASTRYTLHQDVTTNGTAFALIASGITFDLNGYTVTYDNATPISIAGGNNSFESDGSGWDFTGAAQASVQSGTYLNPVQVFHGNKSLRFTVPCADQYIATTEQVTLQPNTTYVLSLMLYNQVNSAITLYAEFGGTAVRASDTGISYRGFACATVTYTTGDSPESYVVRVGIAGAAEVAEGYVYVDEIRIGRSYQHGVLVGPKSTSTEHPDISKTGYAYDSTVRNGTITQGQDEGFRCCGVYARGSVTPAEYDDLTISVDGFNTSAIHSGTAPDILLHDCTLTSTSRVVMSRDSGIATVDLEEVYGGEVYGNTIYGAPWCALKATGGLSNGNYLRIHHNAIYVSATYTNGACIFLMNDTGTQIYNNTMNGGTSAEADAAYSGHGINFYGEAGGCKIYDNVITVRALQNNQEYSVGSYIGFEYDGVFGIHMRDGNVVTTMDDVEVYSNDITSYGVGWEGHCVRLRQYCTNINIHDNNLTAVHVSGTAFHMANIFRLAGDDEDNLDGATDGITIHGNTIKTNAKLLMGYAVTNITLDGNSFELTDGAPSPNYLLVNLKNTATEAITNLRLVDTTYTDAGSRAAIAGATIVDTAASPGASEYSDWAHAYTLSVNVSYDAAPQAGATVTIDDATEAEVFTGETGAGGSITPQVLNEFINDGGVKTEYTPHVVTGSYLGAEDTAEVTMDGVEEVTIALVSA